MLAFFCLELLEYFILQETQRSRETSAVAMHFALARLLSMYVILRLLPYRT